MQVVQCNECRRQMRAPPAVSQEPENWQNWRVRCEYCGGLTKLAHIDATAGPTPVGDLIDILETGQAHVDAPPLPKTDVADTNVDATLSAQSADRARGIRVWPGLRAAASIIAERWYAWRTSREMLDWYRRVHRTEPHLTGAALYQQVIVRRSRLDVRTALGIVRRAEQSFCAWPAERELQFRDVVQYVVVNEYL